MSDPRKKTGEFDTPRPSVGDRISDLLETVQAFAAMDFSRRAHVGDEGDDLDALAAGINMLGEEIQSSQEELEQRVEERTQRLEDLTRSLESEVADRQRNELAVRETNARLSASLRHLEEVNREIEKLTELSNLLQVCSDRSEAFSVLGHVGPELFSGTEGAVYVFLASRDVIKVATTWGNGEYREDQRTANPSDCWALRRGRIHRSHADGGLRCNHVGKDWDGETLCVPLIAQGDTTGLLHLRWKTTTGNGDVANGSTVSYDKLAVAASEQIALALANLDLKAALQAQSIRDPLTSLFNRRYMDETLTRELRRAERGRIPVAFMMLDADHFKRFNDTYGHDAGDAVLKHLAGMMSEAVRAEDVVCRYGGEEFAIIMSGANAEQAYKRAEELREQVANEEFDWSGGPTGKTTISIGIAVFPDNARSREMLIRTADRALYEAKNTGRDRVVISTREPEPDERIRDESERNTSG